MRRFVAVRQTILCATSPDELPVLRGRRVAGLALALGKKCPACFFLACGKFLDGVGGLTQLPGFCRPSVLSHRSAGSTPLRQRTQQTGL